MRISRFRPWFPLAAMALLMIAGKADAQDRTGTVEITPFGGGYFGGRLYEGSNVIFPRDVDVRSAGTYGIRVGVNANRWLGIEAGFATARADIEERVPSMSGHFEDRIKLGTLDVKQYELNGILNFGRRRAIPYFTLGAGATTFRTRAPGVDVSEDTRFTANMGLGVKVFVNPHVGLRFEGRGRTAFVDNSPRCSDRSSSCDGYYNSDRSNRGWYTSGEVTGGITAAF
jgi:hypothetical protein